MRHLITSFIILTLSLVMHSQVTLDECKKQARENHPFAKEKERIENSNLLKQKNTSSQWLPQLNANAQATYQSDAIEISMLKPDFSTPVPTFTQSKIATDKDQYKLTLDVNQLIYDGGSIKAQKNSNDASTKAEELQVEAELQKIDDQVNNMYFNILICEDRIKLFENVRNSYLEREKNVEAGLKNGVLQQSDLDNINIELLKNQQQIDELQLSRTYLIINLSQLTGKEYPENTAFVLPEVKAIDSVNWLRPDLQAFDAQKEGLNFNADLVKTQRMPKVYAFAQAGYGKPGLNMLSNDFNPFYIVGVSLKWNIWDWDKSKRDRQLIAMQNDMLDNRKSALELNLRIMLNNSKSQIDQLEKALETDKKIVELRKEVTQRSASKLDNGVITSADFILDQNAEVQAIIQLQTHEKQLIKEKLNYLLIQGKN